jgi:hypothetical protein
VTSQNSSSIVLLKHLSKRFALWFMNLHISKPVDVEWKT